MAIFATFGQNHQNENFSKKKVVLFFTLFVPQLHAEFQKNRWSGFRDQFVTYEHTYEHTDKGDITEPVAFAGSITHRICLVIVTGSWSCLDKKLMIVHFFS